MIHSTPPTDIDTLPANHLLEPQEVSQMLNLTVGTLGAWRTTGRYGLRFTKIGRKVFYRVADVKEFIDRRTQSNTRVAA
jgi:hypothetical protein